MTAPDPIAYRPHRFSVDEYYRLAEADILTESDRVELIDGQILVKEPIGPEHGGHTIALTHLFTSLLRDRALISVQGSIHIDDYNEPQPDLSVCRPREDFYKRSHPTPADLYLIIEVAWTSALRDREVKVPLYGAAGIPEYWIVDVPHRMLEVYRGPTSDGYDRMIRLRAGDTVRLSAFDDIEIRVEDVVSLD